MNSELLIYYCKGEETEIKEWFKTINIAGIPINEQEMLNAIYLGPFVTLAKAEFSNSSNVNFQKWSAYLTVLQVDRSFWQPFCLGSVLQEILTQDNTWQHIAVTTILKGLKHVTILLLTG